MFVRYTFTLNVGGYSTEYDELSILTKKWFETLSRAYNYPPSNYPRDKRILRT